MFEHDKGEEEVHAYRTKLEKQVGEILTPLQEFVKSQSLASFFLIFSTFVALMWASIPYIAESYRTFIHSPLGFVFGDFIFQKSVKFWVNDILLTIFFFYVGLEIKREFLIGELSDKKKALFVIFAAVGGMVVPAALYTVFNWSSEHILGWGVPMATDTAFALGIASCFKRRISQGIFTFLAALAIIDDIGAIFVIAIFYTKELHTEMFLSSSILTLVLILFNYMGIRKPTPYLFIGLLIWLSVHAAGIHGTVSGIIIALVIPARPEHGPMQFIRRTISLLKDFKNKKDETPLILEDKEQHAVLEEVQDVAKQATTPLQRWESKLDIPVALFILPIFALVNAGIPLQLDLLTKAIQSEVAIGIFSGLVLGKPLGICGFGLLALYLGIAELPANAKIKNIISASFLAGIGFTMSLFIANLSFGQEQTLYPAKAAILLASFFSAMLGIFTLYFSSRKKIK